MIKKRTIRKVGERYADRSVGTRLVYSDATKM